MYRITLLFDTQLTKERLQLVTHHLLTVTQQYSIIFRIAVSCNAVIKLLFFRKSIILFFRGAKRL